MDASLQIIILGAGFATGFRPLSLFQPKILAPVCNIGLLSRILHDLKRDGFDEATLVLRFPLDSTLQSVAQQTPEGFRLTTVFVPATVKGSVDSARFATQPGKTPLLIIAGDSLINADFHQLVEAHRRFKKDGAGATILYHFPEDIRIPGTNGRTYHGVVSLQTDQRISRFVEKPLVSEICSGFDAANAAVFVCESSLLMDPEFDAAADFSFDLFTPLSKRTPSPLFGVDIGSGFRLDLGNIQRFFEINKLVLQRKIPIRMPGSEISPGIWASGPVGQPHLIPPCVIGANARIGTRTRIGPNTIIGDDVQVGSGSLIENSIVLSGAKLGDNVTVCGSIVGEFAGIQDGVSLRPGSVCGPYSIMGAALT